MRKKKWVDVVNIETEETILKNWVKINKTKEGKVPKIPRDNQEPRPQTKEGDPMVAFPSSKGAAHELHSRAPRGPPAGPGGSSGLHRRVSRAWLEVCTLRSLRGSLRAASCECDVVRRPFSWIWQFVLDLGLFWWYCMLTSRLIYQTTKETLGLHYCNFP